MGFNYALSNLQAAVGLAPLERLDEFVGRRRMLADRYAAELAGAPGLSFTVEAPWSRSNYWLMSVLVEPTPGARSRKELTRALAAANVEARPLFTPLPLLDAYASTGSDPGDVPVSRDLHGRGLSIPSSASLDREQQDRGIAVLVGDE